MYILCSPNNFHSMVLAPIDNSSLNYYCRSCKTVIFYHFSTLISWYSLSHTPLCLLIFVPSILIHLIFKCPISSWLLYHFDMSSSIFFEQFLICWPNKIFQLSLYFLCFGPGISHFTRGTVFFQWGMVFRNKGLGTMCVGCCGECHCLQDLIEDKS